MALLETLALTALAAVLALAPRLIWSTWSPWHALAAGAILYPSLDTLIDFAEIAPLIGRYTELEPYTIQQLNRLPWRILESNLGLPLAGLGLAALFSGGAVAVAYRRAIATSPRAWGRELGGGLALAPLFIGAQFVALAALQGPLEVLQTGDESALFANATIWHALALCLAPALAEELYYRGLLQTLLEQVLPGSARAWLALAIQGIVFAFAHAGFTTISHLLGPLMFGLAMGYVRGSLGLGACILLHASINLAYFAVDPGAGGLLLQAATVAVVLAGLVVLALRFGSVKERLTAGLEALGPAGGGAEDQA